MNLNTRLRRLERGGTAGAATCGVCGAPVPSVDSIRLVERETRQDVTPRCAACKAAMTGGKPMAHPPNRGGTKVVWQHLWEQI